MTANKWYDKLTSWATYWLSSYGEIECPGCGREHEVDWQTEYGEPYDDKYLVECLSCGKEFAVTVVTKTTYTTEEV